MRNNVLLDEFVIIPNHLHGILFLREWDNVGAHCNVPLPLAPQIEQFRKSTVNSIPTIIKLFKSTVTKQINELRGTPGKPVWQRNYGACPERSRRERVIRDEDDLNRIREYIIYNPLKWTEDEDNPQNWK